MIPLPLSPFPPPPHPSPRRGHDGRPRVALSLPSTCHSWLFERTRANDADVIVEPSIRFSPDGDAGVEAATGLAAIGFESAIPVLSRS